jgi:hypothetical protein
MRRPLVKQYDCAIFFVNVGLTVNRNLAHSEKTLTSAQGKIIIRDNELIGSNLYTKYCIILDETFVGTFQIV